MLHRTSESFEQFVDRLYAEYFPNEEGEHKQNETMETDVAINNCCDLFFK